MTDDERARLDGLEDEVTAQRRLLVRLLTHLRCSDLPAWLQLQLDVETLRDEGPTPFERRQGAIQAALVDLSAPARREED